MSLQCRQSDYHEQWKLVPPRVFVGYSIYKGKAALTVERKAPEFTCFGVGSKVLSCFNLPQQQQLENMIEAESMYDTYY
ncbi:hypothetical protein SAY87_016933 [Trapa incisa]|uniref:Uncharacterized protein n=1 Tax=Trapa incisa TaxID=236973 RepID=A0AAN7QVR7_9MYRT|nr:hypothetical protein SAY87_016933 [Trapa incisa]